MKRNKTSMDPRVEALTDIITRRMSDVSISLIEARLDVMRDPGRPFTEADKYRLVSAASDLVIIANKVLALAETT